MWSPWLLHYSDLSDCGTTDSDLDDLAACFGGDVDRASIVEV